MYNISANMKIGIGFDIHRLADNRRFILGGVHIPHERGPAGHSDGDALLHALSDAILGALGKPDIGCLFPDTDPRTEGMNSSLILAKALSLAAARGLKVNNADIVILCERPAIAPHYSRIRASLAQFLSVPEDSVGVKAKTMEGLGEIGAGNAVACFATVCLTVCLEEACPRADRKRGRRKTVRVVPAVRGVARRRT